MLENWKDLRTLCRMMMEPVGHDFTPCVTQENHRRSWPPEVGMAQTWMHNRKWPLFWECFIVWSCESLHMTYYVWLRACTHDAHFQWPWPRHGNTLSSDCGSQYPSRYILSFSVFSVFFSNVHFKTDHSVIFPIFAFLHFLHFTLHFLVDICD